MSTAPNIQVLDNFLQTPEFDAFKQLTSAQTVGDFTLGEIFANDPVRLNAFLEAEYLQQKAEEGNETAAGLVDAQDTDITNATYRYLQRYQKLDPVDQTALQLDTQPRQVAVGREQGLPIDIMSTFGQESDYSALTESMTDEEERQRLVSLGVDPDVIYEGDKNFYQKFMQGSDPVDENSPWRVKSFFFPINITPFEAEKLLEKESPNAEFRYIDPRDPSMGVAIRDESTNGRFVPLRPQFGYEMGMEELITGVGQETAAIVTEVVGLKGLGKLIGEAGEQTTRRGKVGRGAATVGLVGLSAGMGRFAQLAYGNAKGINDVSVERAFDDAKLAALLGGAGAAVIGGTLATLGTVWRGITGKKHPE